MKEQLPDLGQLLTQINDFLSSPVLSNDGGYAPVGSLDWQTLHDIIQALILLKWGPDSDGDRPVQYRLINRHTDRPVGIHQLPYSGPTITNALHMLSASLSLESEARAATLSALDTLTMHMPTVHAVVDDKNHDPLEERLKNLRRSLNGRS